MKTRRVLLLSVQPLLSESLATVLQGIKGIELLGPLAIDDDTVHMLAQETPDIVLIAEREDQHQEAIHLAGQILEMYPELPVVQVGLNQNLIRLYNSQVLPAHSTNLINFICEQPVYQGWSDETNHQTQNKDSGG